MPLPLALSPLIKGGIGSAVRGVTKFFTEHAPPVLINTPTGQRLVPASAVNPIMLKAANKVGAGITIVPTSIASELPAGGAAPGLMLGSAAIEDAGTAPGPQASPIGLLVVAGVIVLLFLVARRS